MLTLFTTAKPFRGHYDAIQRNALNSWKLLHPDVEVILFGDELGAAQISNELGLRHEPHVERNEELPYVNSMFTRAQEVARHEHLCYSNCDIILMKDFWSAFMIAAAWRTRFLMVAQRWDTDISEPIDFTCEKWPARLRTLVRTTGHLQVPDYIDFFLFSKGLYFDVPALVVGRSYWDHWMVWRALSEGAAVLDATRFVMPVHQNHGYAHHPQGHKGILSDALAKRNLELAGNGEHLRSMLDSTHRLTRFGEIRRTRFRRIIESPTMLSLRQKVAEGTFPIRDRLGLRRQTLDKIRRKSPPTWD